MPNNGLHNVTGALSLAPVTLGLTRKQQSSVQHGTLVTMNGTGFGTRVNAKPLYVSLGPNKTPNSTYGRTTSTAFEAAFSSTSTSKVLGQSGGSVAYELSQGTGYQASFALGTSGTKPIITFKERYYDFDITNPALRQNGLLNIKTDRLWSAGYTHDILIGYAGEEGSSSGRITMENVSGNSTGWIGTNIPAATWLSEEATYQRSSASGVHDGQFRLMRNNVLLNPSAYLYTTRDGTYSADLTVAYLDQSSEINQSMTAYVYYAYICMDDEYNAVYIGNAATRAACTKLVRMPSAAWSPTQIQFYALELSVPLAGAYTYVRTGLTTWASDNGVALT